MYMLGEIRSDVKGIMSRMDKQDERIGGIETKVEGAISYIDTQKGAARVWAIVSGMVSSVVIYVGETLIFKR